MVNTQGYNDGMCERSQEEGSALKHDNFQDSSTSASHFRKELLPLIPALRAFARFLARNPSIADDLVQETILRALAKCEQYEQDTNLKAWVFSILRNLFLEQVRRAKKEQEVLDTYAFNVGSNTTNAPEGPARQAVQDLDHMLWQLSPLLREALVLIGAQEMTYEEAASICGASVGTMKARVSRARAELLKHASPTLQ